MSAAAEFQQLAFKVVDPIQHDYEVIRPIMLLAESVAERSRQLDIDRTVIGAKARRFLEKGMLDLVDQRALQSGRKGDGYSEPVAL
jgi:hypothetical protein